NLPRLGWNRRGFPLVTRTLLCVAQQGRSISSRSAQDRPGVPIVTFATDEPALQVFDKTTGVLLAQIELPANASGALMTSVARGRQYTGLPVGRPNIPPGLVALGLPC